MGSWALAAENRTYQHASSDGAPSFAELQGQGHPSEHLGCVVLIGAPTALWPRRHTTSCSGMSHPGCWARRPGAIPRSSGGFNCMVRQGWQYRGAGFGLCFQPPASVHMEGCWGYLP